ncbi:MAG TPA: 50S ribosomal protein L29 [Pyrinomonadaceae bacterium]|jgi:large subunit ribosomal protein L29|nr:50S ribosomal protein L29 [Pyrinomonadaceae bacterium]
MKRKEELERLNEMSLDDLREEADRLKESLFRLKFRHALSDMEAVKNIRREKKTLARINTFIRRRAEAAETQQA